MTEDAMASLPERLRRAAPFMRRAALAGIVGQHADTCEEAADEIEGLRRALERIASKNDLSVVADADLQTRASVAFGALAECEMLARNALDD